MRKVLCIAMPILLFLTIVTGIAEADISHIGLPVFHIVVAALFVITLCAHAWLNRKVLVKYYKTSS